MNWNQFRQAHKGLSKTEVSDLWKKYKEGEYEVEGVVDATPEEIRVPVGDVEVKIKPGTDGEFGTADDVFNKPKDEYTKKLLEAAPGKDWNPPRLDPKEAARIAKSLEVS